MLSESQKRKGHLSILEKLRSGGMPDKSSNGGEVESDGGGMEMMFAQLDENGDIVSGEEEKKKKKKRERAYERDEEGKTRLPAENQPAAKQIMKSFGR